MDLFRAIFKNTDSEDSSSSDEEQDEAMEINTEKGNAKGKFCKLFEHKNVVISFFMGLKMCLGAQGNRLIETVLLNTQNTCYG